VAVKISPNNEAQGQLLYGRQFDHKNALYSKMSRDGIESLKTHFKDDLTAEDWRLVARIKRMFVNGVMYW